MRTGERLDDESPLYRADLVRHRAAYRFADSHFAKAIGSGDAGTGPGGLVLDLGCGTGYGAAYLAAKLGQSGVRVVALDRVFPAASARASSDAGGACFVRGDLERLPFAARSVDAIASFQVIEHFADAGSYLAELGRVLRPDGVALVSTPNRLESDGENPFHLREYAADELGEVLALHFERVEVFWIHARGPAARYHADRLRQIRRVTRLDPLGLRRRLPRGLVEWAFARLSLLVRLGARRSGAMEQVGEGDYRVERVSPACVDLLAVCHGPRPQVFPAGR